MAYPNNTEISNAANTLGVDPIVVYAYAAIHGRVPQSPVDVQQLQESANSLATAVLNTQGAAYQPISQFVQLIYGYEQAVGSQPYTWWSDVDPWAVAQGYLQPSAGNVSLALRFTGKVPFAGQGYPPGNQPTNPTQPTTSPQQPPPTGGFDPGSLMKNPFVLGGAALVGAYALGIFPRRR